MRVDKIAEQENNFKETLTNTSRVKYTIVGHEDGIVKIRPNFDSYYYQTETKKKKIVLHYTVGTIRGDMASLTKKDNHMSVSYVIARNGSVYELFDPKYWSYHLGVGSVGGNKYGSSESIGIELSNYGPLNLVGDNLETIYSQVKYKDANGNDKISAKDIYCSASELQYYDVVPGGLRGYEYFASFTTQQLEATKKLVKYLCEKFDIPQETLPDNKLCEVFSSSEEARNFSGICSHINYRKSGKWDIGTHFPWKDLRKQEETPKQPVKPEIKEVEEAEPVVINAESNVIDVSDNTQTYVATVKVTKTVNKFKFVFDLLEKILSRFKK